MTDSIKGSIQRGDRGHPIASVLMRSVFVDAVKYAAEFGREEDSSHSRDAAENKMAHYC